MIGRVLRFIGFIGLLAALAAIVLASWILREASVPGPLVTNKVVVIEPATPTQKIADKLVAEKVLSSPLVFLGSLIISGQWGALQAGEYEFLAGSSAAVVITQLAKGQVMQRRLTIPEGLSVVEIKALIDAAEGLQGSISLSPQEGRLLPETYLYTRGMTRDAMVARMVKAMDEAVSPLWSARPADFPLKSIEEVLTLASIIEKETGQVGERGQVASVFYNRLRVGMKLQSDPTVIYALTRGAGPLGRELLTKDLQETDSPYNTYRYAGLPPGPIANPGLASIRAVFDPASTDYFYFVADGTGGHVFARSLAEHNANVARWRAFERAQKRAN
jgi:UPF0755 protein